MLCPVFKKTNDDLYQKNNPIWINPYYMVFSVHVGIYMSLGPEAMILCLTIV